MNGAEEVSRGITLQKAEILEQVLSAAGIGIVIYDRDLRYIFWNKTIEEFTGVPAVEVLGKSAVELFPHIREQNQEQLLFRALHGESIPASDVHFSIPHTGKSGWVSVAFDPLFDESGQIFGVVGLFRNITERKQIEQALQESEERYRNLYQDLPIGAYRTTRDGRILDGNPALVKMLGYGSLSELMTRNLEADFEPQYSRHEFIEQVERDGEIHGLEAVWNRKDGAPIYVREHARVIRADDGHVLWYEGTVEDITDKKKIEKQKDELVSVVAHELRTPLTSIRGSLTWILDNGADLPDRVIKLVQLASRSSERLVRMINDLLDIDKIESGKMAFKSMLVPVKPFLHHAIEVNRGFAEQYGVRFVLQVRDEALTMFIDADRLMQVLTNLLSNAVKYSPPNDFVQIEATNEFPMVRISVSDHGPGISEEFQPHIFEKFAQANSRSKQGSSGLGLSISKVIVEKMHGKIGFVTAAEKGTTFFVDLPQRHE
ncbi:MAG: hypothetical protein C5B54_07605 [Acidobacteria bacterium]|nr:MAG: hypothetical protein C5B54_07605 [Acidobacteriota bacterium]